VQTKASWGCKRIQSPALEQQAYREQFELEDSHWWFEGRRAVIWALLARAGVGRDLRILDAGCGTGRNMLEFGSLGPVAGVDSSPDAIEFARRRGADGAVQGRLEQLQFSDRSFDLILATDVLEHLADDRAVLRELRRVTEDGGRLLATVPAYPWLWSQHDDAHHHFRRYTLATLRERLQAEGWEPVVWSYFNSLLLAPIAAVRTVARRRPPRSGGRPDLRLTPRPLNRMLLAPMRAEAALIGRGARLPAGVSIGIVCLAGGVSAPRPAPAARAEPEAHPAAHPGAGARGAPR
jgi:ubiquinone/menaquinone biosynthesis C-methylase UbiE